MPRSSSTAPSGGSSGASSARSGRPPTTVANYVTEAIRTAILEGRYPLGSRLDQQMLADELGASIIPVREGLRQMEAEGLVQITPHVGAFVIKPTDEEVREVYRLRAVLEAFATKEAVPALTADDITELEASFKELARLGRSHAYDRWSQVNREWHFKLYGAARSPLLLQFIGTLWDRCRLTSHAYARDISHRSASNDDHSRIMKAVRQRDADLAAEIIAAHVRSAMDDLLRDVP
jgi:DNA-binding GntR family transcriptional regulator